MGQLEDSADNCDQKLVQQYPWTTYKYLPSLMAISIEATVLKELCREEVTLEQCGQLLKDSSFRDTFLRCWEAKCFDELRAHENFPSQEEHLRVKAGQAPVPVDSSDLKIRDGQMIISDSTFYDVAGDVWNIYYSDERQEKIAKWLSLNDQRVTHNAVAKKRAPHTGNRFINSPELMELCDTEKSTKRILWCPGIPGVGKTVTASLAIDYLRRRSGNTFVGFVYFDFKLRSLQNLSFVLNALCRQVFETCEQQDVSMIFSKMYDVHKKRNTRPTISELQHAMRNAFGLVDHCFLVLDALDEYHEQYSDAKIRELLDALLSLSGGLRLIVTSRPLSGLVDLFKKLDSSRREVEATDEDIRRYIEGRLDDHEFNFDIGLVLKERIIGSILNAAKGRFLMAALNMDSLTDELNPGGLNATLRRLPDQEDAAYAGVMKRINGYQSNRKEIAMKAILLTAYCSKPLTIEAIRHAIAADEGIYDVEEYLTPISTITSACAGILVVRGNNIVFVHFTAQEFFDDPQTQVTYFPDANLDIARICLDYLTLGVLTDDTLVDEFPIEIRERLPFYDYAALHCGSHLNGCDKTEADSILLQMWCFLSENTQAVQHCAAYLLWKSEFWLYPVLGCQSTCYHYTGPIPGAPLFVSIYHNQTRATQRLLDNVQSIPKTNGVQWVTPLWFITKPDQMAIIKFVIQKFGIKPKVRRKSLLLHHVVAYEIEEAVEYFLAQSPMVLMILHTGANFNNKTPLEIAMERGNRVIAASLLDFEASLMASTPLELTSQVRYRNYRPFRDAISGGNRSMVELMLEHGALELLGLAGYSLVSFFPDIIEESFLEILQMLLEAGANVNACNDCGETLLSLAAESGEPKTVQLILEYEGLRTLNSQDNSGRTPLSRASDWFPNKSEECAASCVSFLLEQSGIDIHLVDCDGRSPLYYAYKSGYTSIVAPLLQRHGARLPPATLANPTTVSLPMESLLKAAFRGQEAVVKQWLESGGITIEPRDARGATPLSLAAQEGHGGIVELLLEVAWVNVNAEDKQGKTPLHHALSFDDPQIPIIQRLLQHPDIDLTKVDEDDECYLTTLLKRRRALEVGLTSDDLTLLNLLLSQGDVILEMVNSQDAYGNTPVSYAAGHCSAEHLQAFFGVPGVNLNIRNHSGETPLMLACSGDIPLPEDEWRQEPSSDDAAKVVNLLLGETSVIINAQDNSGRTALSWAVWRLEAYKAKNFDWRIYQDVLQDVWDHPKEYDAKKKVSALFSSADLDVNLPDKKGRTPLWYARQLGYDRVARMLISKGAHDLAPDSMIDGDNNARTPDLAPAGDTHTHSNTDAWTHDWDSDVESGSDLDSDVESGSDLDSDVESGSDLEEGHWPTSAKQLRQALLKFHHE